MRKFVVVGGLKYSSIEGAAAAAGVSRQVMARWIAKDVVELMLRRRAALEESLRIIYQRQLSQDNVR